MAAKGVIADEMRRFAEALRAGEVVGDVADEIERFAERLDEERNRQRMLLQDAFGEAALSSQRSGNTEAAFTFLAAAGMVS